MAHFGNVYAHCIVREKLTLTRADQIVKISRQATNYMMARKLSSNKHLPDPEEKKKCKKRNRFFYI